MYCITARTYNTRPDNNNFDESFVTQDTVGLLSLNILNDLNINGTMYFNTMACSRSAVISKSDMEMSPFQFPHSTNLFVM